MRSKYPPVMFIATIILSFLVFVSCKKSTDPTNGTLDWTGHGYTQSQIETLKSLEKMDDFPFYVMTYHGDYGFNDNLFSAMLMKQHYHVEISTKTVTNWACTCFAAMGGDNNKYFGRNFDFYHRPSLILFTNPPNAFASVSMVDIYYCGYNEDTPISAPGDRAGLLNTPFYPFDGINEHGVTIGLMAVSDAQPPHDPSKRTLWDLEVIRLVLDYATSTEEAVSLIKNYNVRFGEIPLHYLIADPTGHSAVIEFVNDRMVVIRNTEPFQVSTNFILNRVIPHLAGNCWRYDTTWDELDSATGIITHQETMNILNNVSQDNTMWSAVYNMITGDISVTVGRKYDLVHSFKLALR